MQPRTPSCKTTMWQIPSLGGVELLHAPEQTHTFPRHTHQQYAIGVIERGALGFYYRGQNLVATTGNINLCIPGEMHTGHPARPEGWSYRMFYFDPQVLQKVARLVADKARDLPFIPSGVLEDPALAQQLLSLHQQLEQPTASLLVQETTLLQVLSRLICRYTDDPPRRLPLTREPSAVRQTISYLEAHHAQNVSLEDLSRHTQLSPYHLIRVFREAVGVPPHAYLRQVRVHHAKRLLAAGQPIAEVALAAGFSDQSHLTRWLKRLWGFTPAQYRNNVQDNWVSVA